MRPLILADARRLVWIALGITIGGILSMDYAVIGGGIILWATGAGAVYLAVHLP